MSSASKSVTAKNPTPAEMVRRARTVSQTVHAVFSPEYKKDLKATEARITAKLEAATASVAKQTAKLTEAVKKASPTKNVSAKNRTPAEMVRSARTITQRVRAFLSPKYKQELKATEARIAGKLENAMATVSKEKTKFNEQVKEHFEYLKARAAMEVADTVSRISVPKGNPSKQRGGKKTRRRNRH